MTHQEAVAVLKALERNLKAWCDGIPDYKHYVDHDTTISIYGRYCAAWSSLSFLYPSIFNVIPISEPRADSQQQVNKEYVIMLLREVKYCMDLMESLSLSELGPFRVTKAGVFFAGQYFDALQEVREIFQHAQVTIALIDGYVDDSVLRLLTCKLPVVNVAILTKSVSPALISSALAFNKQYGGLSIRKSAAFHDRFLIVDDRDFFHFGASIKDAGHKGFMFSRIEEPTIIGAVRAEWTKVWASAKPEVAP